MRDLISLEKKWCFETVPVNQTHYDSIRYGDIDHDYDIEMFREFFNEDTVTTIKCDSMTDWNRMVQIEKLFKRSINVIVDPPLELLPLLIYRNYILSIDYVSMNKKFEESISSYFLAKTTGKNKQLKEFKSKIGLSAGRENNLLYQAAKLIYYGISKQKVLSMLSFDASQMLKLGPQKGTIESGMFADFTVWIDDPFIGFTQPTQIYSNGIKIFDILSLSQDDPVSKKLDNYFTIQRYPINWHDEFERNHETVYTPQAFENNGQQYWSRNDYFSTYTSTTTVIKKSLTDFVNPTKNVRTTNNNYVITGITILDTGYPIPTDTVMGGLTVTDNNRISLSEMENAKWIYSNCTIQVTFGIVKCIYCSTNNDKKYKTPCSIDYSAATLNVYNINTTLYDERHVASTMLFEPIAVAAFIGMTTHHVKSKSIDLDIESLIKNIEQSAQVEIRDDTEFLTRHINSSFNEGIQSYVVNAQVSDFIGGQSVSFETIANNIEEGLIIEGFTVHMTMIDSEEFSISQQFAVLRRLFQEANTLIQKKIANAAKNNMSTDLKNLIDENATVFEKIIAKLYALSVTVKKADAISNLIKMKLQYGFNLVVYGADEAQLVIGEIKLSDTKIIFADIGK